MAQAELHAHQQEAINKMHNGCVLWGDTGVGKTITAIGYALQKEPGKKIVIVTTAKVRDSIAWEKEAAKMGVDPHSVVVTSWNKINDHIADEGKFFIFDEQRLVGAGAWVKAFYKIARKNHWILLSATPGDTWSDYAPMFIANGWYKNITEFRREHAIYSRYTTYPKIEGWRNEGRLVKYRKHLLVEMPMARHTTQHIHYIECHYDKDTLDTVRKHRWNVFEDKPLVNAAELYGVMRKVVSSDPDRRSKMVDLVRTHPRLIVFYNFNYELEILRGICEQVSQEREAMLLGEPKTILSSSMTRSPSGLLLPKNLEAQEREGNSPVLEETERNPESWESKEPKTSPETTSSTPSSLTPEQLKLWWTETSSPSPSTSSTPVTTPRTTTLLTPASDARPTSTDEPSTTPAMTSPLASRKYGTTASISASSQPSSPAKQAPSPTASPTPGSLTLRTTRSSSDGQQLEPTASRPATTSDPAPPNLRATSPTTAKTSRLLTSSMKNPSSIATTSPSTPIGPTTPIAEETSSDTSKTQLDSSTNNFVSDEWADTVWQEGWEPEPGTPDPRKSMRLQKAKYQYEAEERKVAWKTSLFPSETSMTSHPSQKEQDENSSSLVIDGTTRTPIDSPSPTSTPLEETPGTFGSFGWAEWNGHKHQPIPETDSWVYLVQYASGSEGWNCIDTNQMAFWSLTYSHKQYKQARGRIDRLNTPYSDLHYHVLMTDSLAEKPVIKSLEQKKDFQPKM